MTRRSAVGWLGLHHPWPPALRAVAGGAVGWAAIHWGVTESVPGWGRWAGVGVSVLGALAAPAVVASVSASVVAAWAAASALGLYLGVPETDHVVGVNAVLAVLVVASLAGPGRAEWVLVAGLDVVLAWAALRGAPAGGPALVAGLAMAGLLVVAPLTSLVPGPAGAIVPARAQPFVLVALQFVFAVALARQGATRDTIALAAVITGAGLVALVVAARLAVGARSW